MSALSCGCDPEANWVCAEHTIERSTPNLILDEDESVIITLEEEVCIFCDEPLPVDRPEYPYCSSQCAIAAEMDENDRL